MVNMNENIDLCKILKDCPKGWKFWSPMFGEVEFECNYEDKGFINVCLIEDGTERSFVFDATIFLGNIKSKEIMLYPSREQRDWSKFAAPWYKKEKFDPKTLKSFDKVLIFSAGDMKWQCSLFSHYAKEDVPCPFVCIDSFCYQFCIPYNDETKHLVGTTKEAPEYYKYWEE